MSVECPTGLSFHARTWNNGDIGAVLDPEISEAGLVGLKMVERASGACISPGPYPFKVGGQIDFSLVANTDITSAAVIIRRQTKARHEFDANCERCGKLRQLSMDLNDVKIMPASSEAINHLASDAPIVQKIGEHSIELKLIRGMDLPTIAALEEKDQKAVIELQVCASIAKIITPAGDTITGLDKIRRYWKSASWDLTEGVQDAIDDIEGGPDLFVDWKCDSLSCRREQVAVLPLDGAFFGWGGKRRYWRQRKQGSRPSSSSGSNTPAPEKPTQT